MKLGYSPRRKYRNGLIAAVVIIIITAVVYHKLHGGAPAKSSDQGAAVPVTVRVLHSETTNIWTDYSGRLNPVDAAEIRPEVSGRIVKVNFQDGQTVKKGGILFVIEPGPYEAAVAQAEAALATAQSNARFAEMEQKRAETMVKSDAIARRLVDERATANQVANATVKAAQATLQQARINVDRAYVKAPIDGRTGRVELTVGNVVQAGAASPLLTTVVANQNIYADFEVDEQHYLTAIRHAAEGRDAEQKIPVKLKIGSDDHQYDGTIYSFDNQLNVGSGTIRARAKFTNSDGALLPGMFVTVSLANAEAHEALRVPEQAIGFDQSKKYVYVASADNTVEYREVKLGESAGGERIVIQGLKDGDRVITDGVQQVRPGAKIEPRDENAAPKPAEAKGKQP